MKVLIADDDAVIQKLVGNLVGKWGLDSVVAANGDEAWEIIQRDDTLRLALVDWLMPGINGIELARRVREHQIIPFHLIMLTMRGGKENVIEALDAGANDFVTKPFDRDVLEARVRVGLRQVELQSDLIRRFSASERVLAELPVLRDFIPVCAGCGAARDLEGRWRKVSLPAQPAGESGVSSLLCPGCGRKAL